MKRFFLLIVSVLYLSFVLADEGMWLPLLLEKYNYEKIKKKGCKLNPEDLYSEEKPSLKDAVVLFGGGCTGEIISDEGLLITNHHCGYSRIQAHSTVEHDYLTNGFWAMSREEELPNEGLKVKILIRMEEVTDRILSKVNNNMSEEERMEKIHDEGIAIIEEATQGTHYEAIIEPFYYGNQYFMFIYEVFRDIRLVGAPPSAIGKFGGDTDNWMWPRHTGDFSLFRIYVNKDNEPADYDPENVPYKPKRHFKISLKGVEKGDFTLVYGFPGSTQTYQPSFYAEHKTKARNPHLIKIRGTRLEIVKKYMEQDPKIRLQYAAKSARISNGWKKWIGENKGLEKLNALAKKRQFESRLTEWINKEDTRKKKYGHLLSSFEETYADLNKYVKIDDYINQAIYGIEIVDFARDFDNLLGLSMQEETDEKAIQASAEQMIRKTESFYKNYHKPLDKEVFIAMVRLYRKNIDDLYQPGVFSDLLDEKCKGDVIEFADYVYSKSILADKEKLLKFLEKYKAARSKKLFKDPAIRMYIDMAKIQYLTIKETLSDIYFQLLPLERKYMKAQMEFLKNSLLYPEANLTLRVAYGEVKDYFPRDAVHYKYYTTLKGIIQKDNPEIYDYDVPDKLKALYVNKNYGRYARDSAMWVCFIADNHTTGGNSGSPVLNAEGHLVGVNFDRCWEGTMSDIMYDPDQCRNITLDIRYALFLIDKFAGAKHLVEEMSIVE